MSSFRNTKVPLFGNEDTESVELNVFPLSTYTFNVLETHLKSTALK